MISWKESLQETHANIFQLAKIARRQRISTTTCEINLYVQNIIKTKHQNHLGTKHLEIVLKVALKNPTHNFNHILVVAIEF